MRYYIADCHFFHEALNEKMDKRGFESVQAMNEYMIEKWNQKVRRNDEVVILGDFSWGNAEETNDLLDRLHGKLYMIRGNHDYFLQKSDFRAERFVWIKSYAEMQDNQRKVILCHYPVMCYNGQYRLDRKGNPRTYMLYGHVHDTMDQRLLTVPFKLFLFGKVHLFSFCICLRIFAVSGREMPLKSGKQPRSTTRRSGPRFPEG